MQGSYSYDANGNMTFDPQEGLNISYNFLNLTQQVSEGSTVKAKYAWLSDGTKVSAVNDAGTFGYDYIGSLVYKRSSTGLSFESAPFGGGRIVADGNTTVPNYFITDHLGSTRVVVDGLGDAVERSDYFPFGERHANANLAVSDNRHRFSGKEDQDEFGFGFTDFGARMYIAPRWGTLDPLAEIDPSVSPYAYVRNNPINAIDPDGRKILFVNGYLGFGSPRGGSTYWGGVNSSFVRGAQNFFNDNSTYFTDYNYSLLQTGSSKLTYNSGYDYASQNYQELISGMDPQKDVFRIVSHSMGGAFSEGIVKYLKEQGWNVDVAMHFNAWLPQSLK